MSRSTNLLDDTGSAVVEFSVLVPLFLSLFSFGFSSIFEAQLRDQAITAIARGVARSIELGASFNEVSATLEVLAADARLASMPTLRMQQLPGNHQFVIVNIQYLESTHSSVIDASALHQSLAPDVDAANLGLLR